MVVKHGMSPRKDRTNITSVKKPVTMTNLPNRTIKFGLIPVSLCPCWCVTYGWRVPYPFCCSFPAVVSLIWQFRAPAIHCRGSLWYTGDFFCRSWDVTHVYQGRHTQVKWGSGATLFSLHGWVLQVDSDPRPQNNIQQKNKERCASSHCYDANRKRISKSACARVWRLAKQEF